MSMRQLTLDDAIQGNTYVPEFDRERLNAQQLRVLTVMLDGQFRTLGEIQHQVYHRSCRLDPEASISARLRDFRKIGCTVERRRRGDPKGFVRISRAGAARGRVVKAISVRQPWAWLIIHGGKDIENRDWPTKVRGRVLIHAAKGMTKNEFTTAWHYADKRGALVRGLDLQRGGIIGSVEIVDCVSASTSPWFMGRFGFVLRNPIALPFRPFRGALGFFDVPEGATPC